MTLGGTRLIGGRMSDMRPALYGGWRRFSAGQRLRFSSPVVLFVAAKDCSFVPLRKPNAISRRTPLLVCNQPKVFEVTVDCISDVRADREIGFGCTPFVLKLRDGLPGSVHNQLF